MCGIHRLSYYSTFKEGFKIPFSNFRASQEPVTDTVKISVSLGTRVILGSHQRRGTNNAYTFALHRYQKGVLFNLFLSPRQYSLTSLEINTDVNNSIAKIYEVTTTCINYKGN